MSKATRTLTIRLPEELMHDAELIARVDGISFSELARNAITEHLSRRGIDPEFRSRLRALISRDQRILKRLIGD